MAIGSFNKLRLFTWNFRQKIWTEMATKEMKNLYSMTALAWKQDSSRYFFFCLVCVFTGNIFDTDLQTGAYFIYEENAYY